MKRFLVTLAGAVGMALSCFAQYAEGTCCDNLTWVLGYDGCLTISGEGLMTDQDELAEPWVDYISRIKSVVIEDGITNIGNNAFRKCVNLTSVSIPSSVTRIGYGAFYGCTGLTSIKIPEGVRIIDELAFENCSGLQSVELPEGLACIRYMAFMKCSSLKSVRIPESVTFLASYAFQNCSSLTSVSLPDGIDVINNCTFDGCSSLGSVDIPDNVRSIGYRAFNGCAALKSVVFPDKVKYIGEEAFWNCTGLESVSLPENMVFLGYHAFWGCSSLSSVNIPYGLNEISSWLFASTSITSADIPASVNCITEYAFSGCSRLSSVTIPASVASIRECAFRFCSSLTSVVIPEGVRSLGEYAFQDCTSLTSVSIPSTLTSFSVQPFYRCENLASISNYAATPQDIFPLTFESCKDAVLHVLPSAVAAYRRAKGWNELYIVGDLVDPKENQCAAPTISYQDGHISFGCETENSEIKWSMNVDGVCTAGTDSEIDVKSPKVVVSAYAVSPDHSQSETVTREIDFTDTVVVEKIVEKEVIREVTVEVHDTIYVYDDSRSEIVLPSGGTMALYVRDGVVYIENAPMGELVVSYTLGGEMYGAVTVTDTVTALTLERGAVYIIKAGGKTFKIKI